MMLLLIITTITRKDLINGKVRNEDVIIDSKESKKFWNEI